jgi:acyl dehydratase
LPKSTGLEFAKVTGDFNPIHWLPRYARAMGFRNVILHGFGSMAFATEGLNRGLFAGNTHRLRRFDAMFARPLVLPATVGLYVWGERQVGLGDAPGGPAYLAGTFDTT